MYKPIAVYISVIIRLVSVFIVLVSVHARRLCSFPNRPVTPCPSIRAGGVIAENRGYEALPIGLLRPREETVRGYKALPIGLLRPAPRSAMRLAKIPSVQKRENKAFIIDPQTI